MKNKLAMIFAVVMALALVMSGCGATSTSTDSTTTASSTDAATTVSTDTAATAASTDSTTPAAPASTKLVVYSGLSEADMQSLSAGFETATGIKMDYVVGNIGDLTARVDSEMANPQADVLLGGSVDVYDPLGQKGDFEKYSSPDNASLNTLFNDPNGYWQGWYMGVLSIIYNTDLFNKDIAPKGVAAPATWDDLLNPAYKGEFLLGNPASAGGARIFIADQIFRLGGETQAWDYLKKLDQNVSNYPAGMTDVINLVGQGEAVVGMAWAHDSYKAKLAGSPLTIVVPPDTAYEIGGSAIIKGAPDQDNAKKFIDWLLSTDCQALNTKNSYRYPVRNDVQPPEGMPALADVKVVNYDRAKAGSMQDTIKSTFQSEIMDKRK